MAKRRRGARGCVRKCRGRTKGKYKKCLRKCRKAKKC